MFQLIADSGSTKTDWAFFALDASPRYFKSSGINPSLMDDETISRLLRTEVVPELHHFLEQHLPQSVETSIMLSSHEKLIDKIRFYGAGCRPEQEVRMVRLLSKWLRARSVSVASDLLGAAHALCGTQEGIVCILGTGSGSALYDGARFVQSTPSLGYILGDEGSGASLGKHLIADVFKKQLPQHICQAFLDSYQLDVATAIQHIYREEAPNRYMARATHFLAEYRKEDSIQDFLVREFRLFFHRNIKPYGRHDLKVNFVGSIAAVFIEELSIAAQLEGFEVGKVLASPIDALLQRLQYLA